MVAESSGGCHCGDARVIHHKGIGCCLASCLIFFEFDERVDPFGFRRQQLDHTAVVRPRFHQDDRKAHNDLPATQVSDGKDL